MRIVLTTDSRIMIVHCSMGVGDVFTIEKIVVQESGIACQFRTDAVRLHQAA